MEFTNLVLELIHFDTPENRKKMVYMNRHGFYKYSKNYRNPYLG